MISKKAKIGQNITIKENVLIDDDVVVGDNCYLDYGCILRAGVRLGANSYVGPYCVLGELKIDSLLDRTNAPAHQLEVGKNALIRSHTVLYGCSTFGEGLQTGHHVTVREETQAGDHLRLGTLSDIQGHCQIGNFVNIHSNVHIGMHTKIGNYVWIFPYSVFTNDPIPPSEIAQGCAIRDYSIVATGSILLPGVSIGENSLVGAGALVTKDVPNYTFAIGSPAKIKGDISQIKDPETGESAYPWPFRFDRYMPWKEIGFNAWQAQQKSKN